MTTPTLLAPIGRSLLLGSFAFTLMQAMRGKFDLSLTFERLVIGMLAISFYYPGALSLESVSLQLSAFILSLGEKDDLKALILNAFKDAASAPPSGGGSTSFNIPALLEQAWRTGVWGVMTALVEGVFLIVSFVLECAREVLWKLTLILFPLAAGVYPVFPRMMGNLILYGVELSLWFPMLNLIEWMTAQVARSHLTQAGSLGLYIVAVEIIAILLIALIPSVTHRFLSGAFAGDFDSQRSLLVWARRGAQLRTPTVAGVGGAAKGGAA